MLWLRWHWRELFAVTTCTVMAWTVSPWFALAGFAVTAQWVRYELANRPVTPPPPDGDDARVKADRPA